MRSRSESSLTMTEAVGIIVGAGVGGGVMAVPYLASKAGLSSFIPVILIAAAVNIVLNLLLVEVLVRDGRDLQIVELMTTYVFRGQAGKAISWVFFGLLGLSFIASLTAYISGAGEVLGELLGFSYAAARLVVYGFSAVIVFFGLKSVGISEKIALGLLLAFALIVGVGSFRASGFPEGTFGLYPHRGKETLALYGIIMYSLNAAFAVPQAVQGLGRHRARSTRAVIVGTLVNAAFIVLVTAAAIAVSRPVTEVAIIGIGRATNRLVAVAGSLFVVVAMLTTYWSVSLALADIVAQRLRTDYRVSWLAATAPILLLIVLGLWDFIRYLQIAGGLVALVVVYVTVPMFRRARRERPIDPEPGSSKILGSPVVLGAFVLGMILMAVGAFLGME